MTNDNKSLAALYNKDYYASHLGSMPYDREQSIWMDYFKSLAKSIIEHFHPDRVMDIGCAKGFLVEHLRDEGVEAHGIDISPYAISEVRPDIQPYCWIASATQPLQEHYDLITCIEVAEHLNEEDGCRLIKNACQHTDVVLFSSTPDDFDEPTHINVQPPYYWQAIFAEHGFYPDYHFDPNFVIPHALCFRRLRKAAPDVAVFSNLNPYEPVALVRLAAPIQTLEQRGRLKLHFFNVNDNNLDFERILNSELFIIHRDIAERRFSSMILEIAHALGKSVIFELDDLLINVPRSNPGWAYFKWLTPDILATLREVDFITVSTESLKKELQYAVPESESKIHVLPNCIDLNIWGGEVPLHTTSQELLVIGWLGTPTHDDDLAIVRPAIAHILSKYRCRVVFKFWGYVPQALADLDGVILVRGMEPDVRRHADDMRMSQIDLAIAPLVDHPFNHSKSNIKWLEYSICRIPGIYSKITPYSSSIIHGHTGWLVDNTTESWVEAIELLINDVSLRKELADNAYREVLTKHSLEAGAERWDFLYHTFVVSGSRRFSELQPLFGNKAFRPARTQITDQWSNLLYHAIAISASELIPEMETSSGNEGFRQARKQIADQWINLPTNELKNAYLGKLGTVHQLLLNSGVKDEPLTDAEKIFVEELRVSISEGFAAFKSLNYHLVAMLYCRADQLPLHYDLTAIPQWLLTDYLKYVLDSPRLFQELGETDNYYHYMQQCIDYLDLSIFSNANSDVWRNVATEFSQIANFIPLYFNETNLKDIYIKRAEILECVLKLNGHEVDYEFANRPEPRKKIRLGILASHFLPAAETFASLPVYEYISRDFEVILYSLNQTGHPLEQYCQSCANSFKLLPKDLADQVNLIRADDLDILFIATNVTAITNQICLLSLHRLGRMQITSVASVVTTGMQHIDYYISGQLTEPLTDAQQHYREKLVKLEGTAHCFSYGSEQEKATIKVDRESLDISEDTVIFISGANFFKITPELIDTWVRIIAGVSNSVLVLLPFGPNWSNSYPKKAFLNHLSTIFSKHGIATDRLIVLDPQPVPNREDVKEYFKIANVYLDSYPFSGTTSLIEPLEVGLSIVSRQGNTFRSSMGSAMLQALNVPDLVADSEESYIQLAIALGTNPELRQQKSAQIKQKMQANPRFLDSRSYSAQMGALFQELFHKHQAITLTENFKLRETNLIIFPDWSHQELLYQDLASVITSLVNHPDKNQTTLLIHTGNLAEDDANLLLAEVVMNLFMEEELDVADGPEISLVGQLGEMQWEALLPCIQARIMLQNENQQAIAQAKAETIPSRELDKYCSTISS